MKPPPRYLAIANPAGKRWQTYRQALDRFWSARGVTPEIELVPWSEVVPREGNLDGLIQADRPALVRLESPGRDTDVGRLLLEVGDRHVPEPSGTDWRAVPWPKGLLLRPGLMFDGFRRVLEGLRRSFDRRSHLTLTACPLAVAEMFDKRITARKLKDAGVPTPGFRTGMRSPDDLLDISGHPSRCRPRDIPWESVYVKLATGSSAAGMITFQTMYPHRSTSTMVEIDGRFYSTRRLQGIDCEHPGQTEALDRQLQFLIDEGVFIQEGVRLAQIDGLNFDVRVVVIRGEPAFTIFRLSPYPMTNLHLGGKRGDWKTCRAAVPTRAWLDALDDCVRAAECFDAATAGVDVVFERGTWRHFVLEVNAFGDFFPGWADGRGRGVHEAGIEADARAMGWVP
ncbi:MAG TPA: STM4014 family protein [Gemmataceae bacterium]